MSRPLRAWVETRLCRCCAASQIVCPSCGQAWDLTWPLPLQGFPARVSDTCDGPGGCGMELELVAIGWALPIPAPEPPAGATPQAAAPADLSDRQRLERLWQQPQPTASAELQAKTRELALLLEADRLPPEVAEVGRALLAASPASDPSDQAAGLQQLARLLEAGRLPAGLAAGIRQRLNDEAAPPPPPRPLPCPADAERHRLADWARRGWLPEGLAPSAVAAAFRRVFGTEPPRDPEHRQTRAYSLRELGLSLGELGTSPNPEPLRAVWDQTLQRVELPATRSLLQQQARLTELNDSDAVVRVGLQWWALVESRAPLLSAALSEVLGRPVHVWTEGVQE